MARPIDKRTLETYERDMAALKRLRTAVRNDAFLEVGRVNEVVSDITRCLVSLGKLTDSLRKAA